MGIETALIHRARQVGSARSATRNAQGEYPRVLVTGPWIPARVMARGSVAAKTRGAGESTEARVAAAYELLLGTVDETGVDVLAPTASSVFETDCAVLGSPTIQLNGEPELLNNGTERIGWLAFGDVPLERS